MIKNNSDSQLKSDSKADKAFLEASASGDFAALEVALAAGASALAVDKDGRTALMWASHQGHAEGVALLLLVSDPLAKSAFGNDALSLARRGQREAAVAVLEAWEEASVLRDEVGSGAPKKMRRGL